MTETRRFIMQGTSTGKLATVKKDGSSHVVPIWFVMDDANSKGRLGDIIFTTGSESIKAKNIHRNKLVSISLS
jgi:nitroimidazol reductase NimA-like FMN-containing flavoprotein (pyridoxamine 5'-phosphate oxidase superfamily)